MNLAAVGKQRHSRNIHNPPKGKCSRRSQGNQSTWRIKDACVLYFNMTDVDFVVCFLFFFGDQAFWTHGSVSEAVLKR